jgi:hypothetical protein
MPERKKDGKPPAESYLCRTTVNGIELRLVATGRTAFRDPRYAYRVIVGDSHSPIQTYGMDSVVRAYRVYLLVGEIMKRDNVEAQLREASFLIRSAANCRWNIQPLADLIGKDPLERITTLRVPAMPEAILQAYMSPGGGQG